MGRPNPPITSLGLPLDSEYADDVDFMDEEEENLKSILPVATEILKSWNLFVNEDKTDFNRVYLARPWEKDTAGKPIAGGGKVSLWAPCCAAKQISSKGSASGMPP